MKRKNKNGKNKDKWNYYKRNKFLNNKKNREDIFENNSDIITKVKNESSINNNSNNEELIQ